MGRFATELSHGVLDTSARLGIQAVQVDRGTKKRALNRSQDGPRSGGSGLTANRDPRKAPNRQATFCGSYTAAFALVGSADGLGLVGQSFDP